MLHHLARPTLMAPLHHCTIAPLRHCANEGEKLVKGPGEQPKGPQTGADYQRIKEPLFADSRLDWHPIELRCEADQIVRSTGKARH